MDPLSSSIPVMRSPTDIMAKGPNGDNFAAGAIQAHPVDRMQRGQNGSSLDIDSIRRLYGSALAMRLSTEQKMASQVGGRLPGMDSNPNSNAMLDSLTGDDMNINFGDFLNVNANRPEASFGEQRGVHSVMEAKLQL